MNPRTRAVLATSAALVLVVVLVVASGRLPRRWHVVIVDAAPAVTVVPEATPRLDALRAAGIGIAWPEGWLPDEATLTDAVDALRDAGWTPVEAAGATGGARATTDAVLDAAYAAGPARGRRVVRLRYVPASRAELDREVGRLFDGLAGPLRPARTLYLVVDRESHLAILGGPPALDAAALPPHGVGGDAFVAWLAAILRIPDGG